MDHKHRKNIRQERARVAREGVGFRIVPGDEATPRDLEAIHALSLQTFAAYGTHPALTLGFIAPLAETMPPAPVLVLPNHHGEPTARAPSPPPPDPLTAPSRGALAALPGIH